MDWTVGQRLAATCLLLACHLLAQQSSQSTTYTYDLNGRRVPYTVSAATRTSAGSTAVESVPSLNGGVVPAERVEEKILVDSPSGRVVERIVKRFAPDGSPLPLEKIQTEERRNPDGSRTVVTTVSRADINGRMSLAEKVSTQARPSASGETATTVVERPTLNGAFEAVERMETVVTKTADSVHEQSLIYRRNANGRFQEMAREIADRRERNGEAIETRAQYESASTGQMQLAVQTTSRTTKGPSGAESTEISIYGLSAPGRPASGQAELREQRLIEKRTENGAVVETLRVRRPSPSDARRLGTYEKVSVSERVCTGACTTP